MSRTGRWMVAAVAAAALAGCSGGGKAAPPAPSITVTPTNPSTVAGGATVQLTATPSGVTGTVTWSIATAGTAAEVGTISQGGLYTPPPSLSTGKQVTVKAAIGDVSGSTTVYVGAAVGGKTLAVSPKPGGTVTAGTTDHVGLSATTNATDPVTWTISPALGSLAPTTGASTTYSAPQALLTAQTDVTVTATVQALGLSDSTTVTVKPTVLTVSGAATVQAGGAATTYTLAQDPGSATVAWTLDPSTGVGSIVGTGRTATYTPPATSGTSPVTFAVIATIGEAQGRASVTLNPAPTTGNVTGTLKTILGAPVAGATVIIGTATRTTDAAGGFQFSGVQFPYDLVVLSPDGFVAMVCRGLTDATPDLVEVWGNFTFAYSAEVSGTAATVGTPQYVQGSVAAPDDVSAWFGADGKYAFSRANGNPLQWNGAATAASVPLHLLQVNTDVSGSFASYAGYGTRTVTVTDGGTLTGQDVTLSAVTNGTVSGSITGDASLGTPSLDLWVEFTDGATLYPWSDQPGFASYSVPVPVVSGGSLRLVAEVQTATRARSRFEKVVTSGLTGVGLPLAPVPTASAPADLATGVDHSTVFQWTNPNTGGTNGLEVDCTQSGGRYYIILGGATSASIPDLSAQGVHLPASSSCAWHGMWVSVPYAAVSSGSAAFATALSSYQNTTSGDRSFTVSSTVP